jgi:hypothetical protein
LFVCFCVLLFILTSVSLPYLCNAHLFGCVKKERCCILSYWAEPLAVMSRSSIQRGSASVAHRQASE